MEGIDLSMMGVACRDPAELGLPMRTALGRHRLVLGYGGFVLLAGRAADLLGRRRRFVDVLVVFIAVLRSRRLATEGWMDLPGSPLVARGF